MNIPYLKELCSLYGASGQEDVVRAYILAHLPPDMRFMVDPLGNLIVHKPGRQSAKHRVMLCAHMDEVGMMITHITDEGFLRFDTVGGISVPALCGKAVRVGQSLLPGVIGVKPVHLLTDAQEKEYPKKESLYIDIGAADKAQAQAVVNIGDYAYFDSDFVTFGDGCIKARAIDDRAGCAILLELLQRDLPCDVEIAFTV